MKFTTIYDEGNGYEKQYEKVEREQLQKRWERADRDRNKNENKNKDKDENGE